MEGGDHQGVGGSRWNPTKEQINMLESLYKQGLRTPSAEQIQQITARLRDFGHIEGKNVFYWFQNHKARQRQKQKQENFAYYNHFLHATPIFPTYPKVICSPCYVPQQKSSDSLLYHQYPKVLLPTAGGNFKRSRMTPESCIDGSPNYNTRRSHQETLNLFPIHPTGILQSPTDDHNHVCDDVKNDGKGIINECGDDGHPYFDFFCRE